MDFCSLDPLFGLQVSSNKPGADGYEVTNLITHNSAGFVCESFITPPVAIRFDFPLSIDIAYIILETELKQRRSHGLKISSLSNNASPSSECKNNTEGKSSSSNPDTFGLGNWFSVSEKIVILKNYNYKHWFCLPPPCDIQKCEGHFISALRNANKNSLNSVNSLIVTITGVYPSGSPVLKSIQIWGQPGTYSTPLERKKVIKLYHKKQKLLVPKKECQTLYNSMPEHDKGIQSNNNQDQPVPDTEIPDEFLDPLTYEIMRLPILLPCGVSIDTYSLEKFISQEAMWGRPASDPFTGIPFKERFKPEPNITLKVRIDRFLLIEQNIPSSCLRSRGHLVTDEHVSPYQSPPSSSPKTQHTRETDFQEKISKKQKTSQIESTSGKSNSKSNEDSDNAKNVLPAAYLLQEQSSRTKKLEEHKERTARTLANNPRTLRECSSEGTSSSSRVVSGGGRHGLVRALGAAMQHYTVKQKGSSSKSFSSTSVLKSPPVVGSVPSPSEEQQRKSFSLSGISSNCLQCLCGGQADVFYSLQCSHILCLKCVNSERNGGIVCPSCGVESQRNSVSRVHPKSAFSVT